MNRDPTLLAGLRAVRRELADIEASASNDAGTITATVSGRGELLELTLDNRIYRDSNARALAADILDTVHAAAASAADQAFTLTTKALERS